MTELFSSPAEELANYYKHNPKEDPALPEKLRDMLEECNCEYNKDLIKAYQIGLASKK